MIRKPTYREQQLAYMAKLREAVRAAARKADPKAFDAFEKAQFERLFPAKP